MSQWIHFIGIAGVAIGQLAVAFKEKGYIVTGSDKGLFPPMSDYIQEKGLSIQIGYKPEHLSPSYYDIEAIMDKKYPDIVVSGGIKNDKNPEFAEAKRLNIDIKYFPEVLSEYEIIDESVVVVGSYGKTTTTAMLVHIFEEYDIDISYMFGALANGFENGVKLSDEKTEFSVTEGDEYIVSLNNPISKFFKYAPKYLIITGIKWDHADVFKTEEEYIQNFEKLIEQIPADGLIVFNEEDKNVQRVIKKAKCSTHAVNFSAGLGDTNQGIGTQFGFKLNILGDYNYKNAVYAAVMASHLIDCEIDDALNKLETFKGIKRRLEVRHSQNEKYIIDDFGASPAKAKSALNSLRKSFPEHKIVSVFEPNLGSRTRENISSYDDVFDESSLVVLPRFTRVKGEYFSNNFLKEKLDHPNVIAENSDDEILGVLEKEFEDNEKIVIVFLGSHGFRGMISALINLFKKS